MFNRCVATILEKLYEYDSVRTVKDYVRPLKHLVFGKSDVYYVVDVIKRAREGASPVEVVLDVGAAVGDKTLTFLRQFPQATIYCFEPQPIARQRFEKRTAPWKDRVLLFDYGLYSENQEVFLTIYSYRDASSMLPLQKFMRTEGKSELGREKITVRRLDDCVRNLSITKIDLIKIDVEGVEKEVLEGGIDSLRNKVDNVFIEISPLRKGPHSADHIETFKLLHDAGFTFMGSYGDYWFSKDPAVLKMYFDLSESETY